MAGKSKPQKKEKKRGAAGIAGKTLAALELPQDFAAGMAHFELSGNREVVVDGCRGVLEYDENVIRLKAGNLTVRFSGRGLSLRNLKRDSAVVDGFIESIEFS